MRKWIFILFVVGIAPGFAAEPSMNSHVEEEPVEASVNGTPAKSFSPQEVLVQKLWGVRLGSRAIDELVRVLQEPSAIVSPATFAAALDQLPKSLLTAEQRTKVAQWFAGGFSKHAPADKRVLELKNAAKKVQAQNRAMLASGNPPPDPNAAPAPIEPGLQRIQDDLKAQLSELQAKVDQALAQRAKRTPRPGRDSSELLDKLLADLEKPEADHPLPTAAPTPLENFSSPSAHENKNEGSFAERDGLRPPPRDDRDSRRAGNQNTNGNGGAGNGKQGGDDKKDDAKQEGGKPFGGKGKKGGEEFSSLKKAPTPKSTPIPFPTPTEEVADQEALDSNISTPTKLSSLPVTSAPGGYGGGIGGAYNAGNFGGSGSGSGASVSAPAGPNFSGDPFASVGMQEYGAESRNNVRAVTTGYAASSGADESGDGGSIGGADEVPVRENRLASFRSQILEQKPSSQARRHWIFDVAGSMVSQMVCEGIDADKVAVCQALKFRAQRQKEKTVAVQSPPPTPLTYPTLPPPADPVENWLPSLGSY